MSTVDPRGQRPVRGITLVLLGYLAWSLMDLGVKLQAERFHTVQIACQNALIALLPCFASIAWSGTWSRIRTATPGLQAVRGILFALTGLGIFWGLGQLPIADVYALLFTIPLWVTALSVPMHKARVGWRRWTAVLVGFAGVMVMLRPGGEMLGIAAVVVLGAAFAETLALLTIRWVPPEESAEAMTIWPYLVIVLVLLPALPWLGRWPDAAELPLILVTGILAGMGSLLVTQAYRDAAAATVAPFQYSQMPYGILIGVVVFGDRPSPAMLLGALIVIASGLYILDRERRHRPG